MGILFLFVFILLLSDSAHAQTIYSHMSAETGNMSQWSKTIADMNTGGNSNYPTASQTRVKNGAWAYKFEMPNPNQGCCDWNYTMVHSYGPNLKGMGSQNGRYLSGFYSFWLYVDAGFSSGDWMTILNWFTGSPISNTLNIELRRWPNVPLGPLQLGVVLKNATQGCYAAPAISGYQLASGGYYFMTASSPQGIVAFPTGKWVHVEVYYKMATTNGQITIWQDGAKIMDLTHPNINTYINNAFCNNNSGDLFVQFGMYSGPKSDGVYRFYMDDFKVSDVRLGPGGNEGSLAPGAPTDLIVK